METRSQPCGGGAVSSSQFEGEGWRSWGLTPLLQAGPLTSKNRLPSSRRGRNDLDTGLAGKQAACSGLNLCIAAGGGQRWRRRESSRRGTDGSWSVGCQVGPLLEKRAQVSRNDSVTSVKSRLPPAHSVVGGACVRLGVCALEPGPGPGRSE